MKHQFHTETLIKNVFSFENPDQLDCCVWQYAAGHSEMGIQLFDNDKGLTYFLEFTAVHYFSGPLKWRSADFHFHPWSESLPLLQELGQIPTIKDVPEQTRKMIVGQLFKLYTVTAVHPKLEIKILSAQGRLREIE